MPLFMALRGIAGLPLPCPQGDVLPLAGGGLVVIDTGSGNTIPLTGVNIADLDAADFIF